MEEKAPDVPEASAPQGDPKRLTYVLLVVAINFIGDALRDALDPTAT